MLSSIDWTRPWLAPYRDAWDDVRVRGGTGWRAALGEVACAKGICTSGGHRIQFVEADDAGGAAYESHVAATGRVPTRGNFHDVFNAVAWLVCPRTKAALNARQALAIARDGVRERRGPVRDAATLIDESGLLLAARDPGVFEVLAAHDWRALLMERRERWQRDIVPLVIGHALLEKLAAPYKAITAAVVCVPLEGDAPGRPADVARIDAAAARIVARDDLAPARLLHLPVLGVPGWWAANEAPSFYDDARVFRPAR